MLSSQVANLDKHLLVAGKNLTGKQEAICKVLQDMNLDLGTIHSLLSTVMERQEVAIASSERSQMHASGSNVKHQQLQKENQRLKQELAKC